MISFISVSVFFFCFFASLFFFVQLYSVVSILLAVILYSILDCISSHRLSHKSNRKWPSNWKYPISSPLATKNDAHWNRVGINYIKTMHWTYYDMRMSPSYTLCSLSIMIVTSQVNSGTRPRAPPSETKQTSGKFVYCLITPLLCFGDCSIWTMFVPLALVANDQ